MKAPLKFKKHFSFSISHFTFSINSVPRSSGLMKWKMKNGK